MFESKGNSFKLLPNFINTQDQVNTSNTLVQTMYAMLNQKISLAGRQKIVEKLEIVFLKIAKF